ncbi:GNAT family N-acetyltransferase [Kineococcus sp. SYSU DK005]|uniref:GNAT family N-acetyltransferase n=1 Tax=Kineococcus sp. SYSU DK005 TaxID=3383126 RepID=UPI003D7D6997
MAEHHREGLHTDLDIKELTDPCAFQRWIDDQLEAGRAGRALHPRDRVPHRVLWWASANEYLGRVRINLALSEELHAFGGHIGYDVRPSARGQGHASAMLAAALGIAGEHGIERALLTCAKDNHASRRVIERNGGRFVDLSTAGRMRFVCTTGPQRAGPEQRTAT